MSIEEGNGMLENQAREETKKDLKKKNGFVKGVFAGAIGTFLAGSVLAAAMFMEAGMAGGIRFGGNGKESPSVLNESVEKKVNEIMGYVNLYFYDEVKEEKLSDGIYAGLLSGLNDPYSQYYTAQEYEDLKISATQNYCGIGAALSQDKDSMTVTVLRVYEGSPAEEAGLKKGDVLVSVGEIESASMELSDLVTHIRGEEGTSVHLLVFRQGETDYLEMDVERRSIDLPTVEYEMLGKQIGYISILEFGAPTVEQFESAVAELEALGMQGMILDVRDNPGGMVTSVTEILDDILPEGIVVYTQDKYGKRQDYKSDEENKMDLPIAVLMNGNSASASEILAGAIRDFKYGTLIGTNTYGKGVVQSVITLSDGDAIKLTTAKYFTPNGENIHGKGIAPDIELEYAKSEDDSKEEKDVLDNQILKAIEVLDKEISAQK